MREASFPRMSPRPFEERESRACFITADRSDSPAKCHPGEQVDGSLSSDFSRLPFYRCGQ
jgi:hypothetical protein